MLTVNRVTVIKGLWAGARALGDTGAAESLRRSSAAGSLRPTVCFDNFRLAKPWSDCMRAVTAALPLTTEREPESKGFWALAGDS